VIISPTKKGARNLDTNVSPPSAPSRGGLIAKLGTIPLFEGG